MNTTEELKELIKKGFYQDNLISLIQHCEDNFDSWYADVHVFIVPDAAVRELKLPSII